MCLHVHGFEDVPLQRFTYLTVTILWRTKYAKAILDTNCTDPSAARRDCRVGVGRRGTTTGIKKRWNRKSTINRK